MPYPVARSRDPARDLVLIGLVGGGAWLAWQAYQSAAAGGALPAASPLDPGSDTPVDDTGSPIDAGSADPFAAAISSLIQAVTGAVSPPVGSGPGPPSTSPAAAAGGTAAALQAIGLAASIAGVDPAVFTAVLYTESRFNPTAYNLNLNGTYDWGPAQLNSATFPNARAMSIAAQLNAAAQFLAGLMGSHAGDLAAAIAAYNGSGAAAQRYAQTVLATAARIRAGSLVYDSGTLRNLAALGALV